MEINRKLYEQTRYKSLGLIPDSFPSAQNCNLVDGIFCQRVGQTVQYIQCMSYIYNTYYMGDITKKRIYLIQIKHLLKMLVPSEVYHQKMKIEMTEYIRAR